MGLGIMICPRCGFIQIKTAVQFSSGEILFFPRLNTDMLVGVRLHLLYLFCLRLCVFRSLCFLWRFLVLAAASFCWVSVPLQVELVADSLEGMERLLEALGKSKSKSKRDDAKLHASLAEVILTPAPAHTHAHKCTII